MSRVGIMTFLHNGNFGSSLQAYALQYVIRKLGYACEHIDYRPDILEKTANLIRCGNSPRLLLDGLKKRKVRDEQAGMQKKYRKIDEFYRRKMELSPVCRNHRDLASVGRMYDILVCGSDQVWNPVWLNTAYFMDFAEPKKTRIAYAASLGVSTVPNVRKQRIIRQLTALFDAVSVREEDGARILTSVTGEKPPVMPDPVCLLTREEWEELMLPPPSSEPYLLCYFIGENPAYWERVETICGRTGLRPMIVPVTAESYRQRKKDLVDGAGPMEFLGALAGAQMICTDSFHGLAFGTIFGKKVDLIRRYREDDRESKNSRVDHFLREVRTKGLDEMRREGLDWLAECLSDKSANAFPEKGEQPH